MMEIQSFKHSTRLQKLQQFFANENLTVESLYFHPKGGIATTTNQDLYDFKYDEDGRFNLLHASFPPIRQVAHGIYPNKEGQLMIVDSNNVLWGYGFNLGGVTKPLGFRPYKNFMNYITTRNDIPEEVVLQATDWNNKKKFWREKHLMSLYYEKLLYFTKDTMSNYPRARDRAREHNRLIWNCTLNLEEVMQNVKLVRCSQTLTLAFKITNSIYVWGYDLYNKIMVTCPTRLHLDNQLFKANSIVDLQCVDTITLALINTGQVFFHQFSLLSKEYPWRVLPNTGKVITICPIMSEAFLVLNEEGNLFVRNSELGEKEKPLRIKFRKYSVTSVVASENEVALCELRNANGPVPLCAVLYFGDLPHFTQSYSPRIVYIQGNLSNALDHVHSLGIETTMGQLLTVNLNAPIRPNLNDDNPNVRFFLNVAHPSIHLYQICNYLIIPSILYKEVEYPVQPLLDCLVEERSVGRLYGSLIEFKSDQHFRSRHGGDQREDQTNALCFFYNMSYEVFYHIVRYLMEHKWNEGYLFTQSDLLSWNHNRWVLFDAARYFQVYGLVDTLAESIAGDLIPTLANKGIFVQHLTRILYQRLYSFENVQNANHTCQNTPFRHSKKVRKTFDLTRRINSLSCHNYTSETYSGIHRPVSLRAHCLFALLNLSLRDKTLTMKNLNSKFSKVRLGLFKLLRSTQQATTSTLEANSAAEEASNSSLRRYILRERRSNEESCAKKKRSNM